MICLFSIDSTNTCAGEGEVYSFYEEGLMYLKIEKSSLLHKNVILVIDIVRG